MPAIDSKWQATQREGSLAFRGTKPVGGQPQLVSLQACGYSCKHLVPVRHCSGRSTRLCCPSSIALSEIHLGVKKGRYEVWSHKMTPRGGGSASGQEQVKPAGHGLASSCKNEAGLLHPPFP